MFKSVFPDIFSINNFKNILHKKSEYLSNLERRKNKSFRIINKTKNELLKQKILKPYVIQRNYKIFSKDKIFIPENKPNKLYFTPNIRPIFLSYEESENYKRYKKKDFEIDNFSLIYKNRYLTGYPIRVFGEIKTEENIPNNNNISNNNYINNSKNNNNRSTSCSFMTSIGNSVMSYNSRYNSSMS